MTALRYEAGFAQDLERIVEFLVAGELADVPEGIADIFDAIELLQRHPLIGRPAVAPWRELVIGRGQRGYVARYRYDELDDEVIVFALRAQREAGFSELP